jgi:hypothetical protein
MGFLSTTRRDHSTPVAARPPRRFVLVGAITLLLLLLSLAGPRPPWQPAVSRMSTVRARSG